MTASRMAGRGDWMLTVEKTVLPSPEQWEIIIEGMRNPKNSWELSDSDICKGADGFEDCTISITGVCPRHEHWQNDIFCIGKADQKLMTGLAKGGPVHAKYRRMIPVFVTINAPLYWWKEFDTYKVGTVCNSCSTMHKIHEKEFTFSDFSCEHLNRGSMRIMEDIVETLNIERNNLLHCGNKWSWWQLIQLLPTSYNQKRTIMLNYEVLCNIYHSRKNHKLDEWHTLCDWIRTLPYFEFIIGGVENGKKETV